MRRVLLDVDGVLANFIGKVCDTIREIGGGDFTPDHVTEFDFAKCLMAHGMSAGAAMETKRIISERPGWWSSLEPFPEAQIGVAHLMATADVYIVTSPWNSCPTWLHERESWLKRYFAIPHSRVLACSAKHIVAGDIFVDDKTETLRVWQQANPQGTAIQWRTPHNLRDAWTGASTRTWSDLVALVQRMPL